MNHDSIKKTLIRRQYPIQQFPEKRKDALLYIAEKGEANIYRISKGLNIRYSTAHGLAKELEKGGFIQLQSEKKNEKGVTAKLYGLTIKGLCAAFAISDDLWLKTDDVTDKWSSLLPVLTKFSLFKKHGLEEVFKEHLRKCLYLFGESPDSTPYIASDIEYTLFDRAIAPGINAQLRMKWNNILHDDAAFRNYTKNKLAKEIRMREQYIEDMKKRLTTIYPELERQEPNWDELNKIELELEKAHIA